MWTYFGLDKFWTYYGQNSSSKLAIAHCHWPALGPSTAQPRPYRGPAKAHPRPIHGSTKAHPWPSQSPLSVYWRTTLWDNAWTNTGHGKQLFARLVAKKRSDYGQNLSSKLAIAHCPWPTCDPLTAHPRRSQVPPRVHPWPTHIPPTAHPWPNHCPPRAHFQSTEGLPYETMPGQILDMENSSLPSLWTKSGHTLDWTNFGQTMDKIYLLSWPLSIAYIFCP